MNTTYTDEEDNARQNDMRIREKAANMALEYAKNADYGKGAISAKLIEGVAQTFYKFLTNKKDEQ